MRCVLFCPLLLSSPWGLEILVQGGGGGFENLWRRTRRALLIFLVMLAPGKTLQSSKMDGKRPPKGSPRGCPERSEDGLGTESGKKRANLKSVPYLLCSDTSGTLKNRRFCTPWASNLTPKLSKNGIRKKHRQSNPPNRKRCNKNVQKGPQIDQKSTQTRSWSQCTLISVH